MAAQAHSKKEDRAIVISARNFIRAFGGSIGLAIAQTIFSTGLISHIPSDVPSEIADQIKQSIFHLPDLSSVPEQVKNDVLDAYVAASRHVFYLWAGAMGLNLLLMVFIKDKGLARSSAAEKPVEEAVGQPVADTKVELPAVEEKFVGSSASSSSHVGART